jgi:hypothetical protein
MNLEQIYLDGDTFRMQNKNHNVYNTMPIYKEIAFKKVHKVIKIVIIAFTFVL